MEDKKQPRQNLTTTIKTTKYMLNYILQIEHGKEYIFLKSFLSVLLAILSVILVFTPGLIINELAGSKRTGILLGYVAMTVGIPLVKSIIVSSLNVYLSSLRNSFMLKVKVDFIRHCADMDYASLENPDMQMLKERAEETTADSLDTFEYLSNLISATVSVVACISIISTLSPIILALVVIVIILNYYNDLWLNKKSFLINKEIEKYNRYGWPIVNYFADLKYSKEIRLYNLKEYFIKLYSNKRIEANILGLTNTRYLMKSSILKAIVSFFQTLVLYGYLINQVINNELAVGSMTIYMGSIVQFINSLTNITHQYLKLSKLSLRVQELMEFMQIPLKSFITGNKMPFFDSNSIIEFKNVSFKYPGSEKYVIKNVSLSICGNEKLCIVGANGSGKSTFIKLLMRLYMPSEGEILLNGININEYDYLQYNKLFSPVFQDFALFNISLRENVVMADRFDSDRLISVVEKCGVSPLVSSNKNGYNTVIYKWYDEEGIDPSGGEGQRIAMARAVYHGGTICILDEPTAALDPNAEYEIYTQFNDIITDKCAILITHRLSAVQLADKVAVFDDGQVAEYGTHAELYAKGGIYTEMFDKQAQFYRDETPATENA